MSEALHIKPGDPARGCEIHEWPTAGLARRLVKAMRKTHGKGGINACAACIERAKTSLPRPRGE